MAAQAVDLCEAVAQFLRDNSYSYTFNVQRVNFAVHRLESIQTTTVYVYPVTRQAGNQTREDFQRTYTIAVHIANFLDSNSQTEIDDALNLSEQIDRSLEGAVLADWGMVSFSSDLSGGAAFFEIEEAVSKNFFHVVSGFNFIGNL